MSFAALYALILYSGVAFLLLAAVPCRWFSRRKRLRDAVDSLKDMGNHLIVLPPSPTPAISRKWPIVTICGSTRFMPEMLDMAAELTRNGAIVLMPFVISSGNPRLPKVVKQELDQMHLAKIDMSYGIYVVNPGGYVGESTRREIEYAERNGIDVRYTDAPPHFDANNKGKNR